MSMDPRDRVQRFVLRARRMMAHSLVREHFDLLGDLASGTFRAVGRPEEPAAEHPAGERPEHSTVTLPPEEAFESFAARVRPFTASREPVYWSAVLEALEKLLTKEAQAEVVNMAELRDLGKRVMEGSSVAKAYSVTAEKGHVTDAQLAELWLDSDALHTRPVVSSTGTDLSLNQRYQAAVGVYARIGAVVNHILFMITHLHEAGLLDLDAAAFTTPVLADTSVPIKTQVYSAELGAPMPTDLSELDPDVWKPIADGVGVMGH